MEEKKQPILKPKRVPLQEMVIPDYAADDSTTATINRSKRVSFVGNKFIKEFDVAASATRYLTEYEQAFSSSDSSLQITKDRSLNFDFSTNDPVKDIESEQNINNPIPPHIFETTVPSRSYPKERHDIPEDKHGPSSVPDLTRQSDSNMSITVMSDKLSKASRFSRTIVFNSDSPTADMTFTSGLFNLAMNIHNVKDKYEVIIKPTKSDESNLADRMQERVLSSVSTKLDNGKLTHSDDHMDMTSEDMDITNSPLDLDSADKNNGYQHIAHQTLNKTFNLELEDEMDMMGSSNADLTLADKEQSLMDMSCVSATEGDLTLHRNFTTNLLKSDFLDVESSTLASNNIIPCGDNTGLLLLNLDDGSLGSVAGLEMSVNMADATTPVKGEWNMSGVQDDSELETSDMPIDYSMFKRKSSEPLLLSTTASFVNLTKTVPAQNTPNVMATTPEAPLQGSPVQDQDSVATPCHFQNELGRNMVATTPAATPPQPHNELGRNMVATTPAATPPQPHNELGRNMVATTPAATPPQPHNELGRNMVATTPAATPPQPHNELGRNMVATTPAATPPQPHNELSRNMVATTPAATPPQPHNELGRNMVATTPSATPPQRLSVQDKMTAPQLYNQSVRVEVATPVREVASPVMDEMIGDEVRVEMVTPIRDETATPVRMEIATPVKVELLSAVRDEISYGGVSDEMAIPIRVETVTPVRDEMVTPVTDEMAIAVRVEITTPLKGEPPVKDEMATAMIDGMATPGQARGSPVHNEIASPPQLASMSVGDIKATAPLLPRGSPNQGTPQRGPLLQEAHSSGKEAELLPVEIHQGVGTITPLRPAQEADNLTNRGSANTEKTYTLENRTYLVRNHESENHEKTFTLQAAGAVETAGTTQLDAPDSNVRGGVDSPITKPGKRQSWTRSPCVIYNPRKKSRLSSERDLPPVKFITDISLSELNADQSLPDTTIMSDSSKHQDGFGSFVDVDSQPLQSGAETRPIEVLTGVSAAMETSMDKLMLEVTNATASIVGASEKGLTNESFEDGENCGSTSKEEYQHQTVKDDSKALSVSGGACAPHEGVGGACSSIKDVSAVEGTPGLAVCIGQELFGADTKTTSDLLMKSALDESLSMDVSANMSGLLRPLEQSVQDTSAREVVQPEKATVLTKEMYGTVENNPTAIEPNVEDLCRSFEEMKRPIVDSTDEVSEEEIEGSVMEELCQSFKEFTDMTNCFSKLREKAGIGLSSTPVKPQICKSYTASAVPAFTPLDEQVRKQLAEESKAPDCQWSLDLDSCSCDMDTCTWAVRCPLTYEGSIQIKFVLMKGSVFSENPYSSVRQPFMELHINKYTTEQVKDILEYGYQELRSSVYTTNTNSTQHVPLFLDRINATLRKLNNHLDQVIRICEGYPGSRFTNGSLVFRIFSFPALFSFLITLNVKSIFEQRSPKACLSLQRQFGQVDENKVMDICENSWKNSREPLVHFVCQLTAYIEEFEKTTFGMVTKRKHIFLLQHNMSE